MRFDYGIAFILLLLGSGCHSADDIDIELHEVVIGDINIDIDLDEELNAYMSEVEPVVPKKRPRLEWDHEGYANNAPPKPQIIQPPVTDNSKKRLDSEPHPNAIAILSAGGKIDGQLRKAVINVHLYFSKISTNPIEATAAAFKMGRNVISRVIANGNQYKKPKRQGKLKLELDEFDKSIIRRIVHGFFRRKEPPTVEKILAATKEELKERFPYGKSKLKDLLRELNFKYGPKQGKSVQLMERTDISAWRTRYLRDIRKYRREDRPLVYLDETWFNCNEAPKKFWQVKDQVKNAKEAKHPGSDITFGLPEASGRGKRLIIVNAIERSGPVPNALLVFPSKSPITPEDYHKDMDASNFEKWFKEKLLPNLKPNSVIIMDNAPYHSRKEGTCALSLKKVELRTCLEDMGFFDYFAHLNETEIDPTAMTSKKMLELWKEHRTYFEYYAVDSMALTAKHTVLRLPPYHCIFNPIEMLWAYQKGLARNQGGLQRSVAVATTTCQNAFSQIPKDDLSRYFDHAIKEETAYWNEALSFQHPSVIIPLYDSDEEVDEEEGTDAEDEF